MPFFVDNVILLFFLLALLLFLFLAVVFFVFALSCGQSLELIVDVPITEFVLLCLYYSCVCFLFVASFSIDHRINIQFDSLSFVAYCFIQHQIIRFVYLNFCCHRFFSVDSAMRKIEKHVYTLHLKMYVRLETEHIKFGFNFKYLILFSI